MAFKEITPAERIRELNSINEEYAAVLQHAGEAVKALSLNAGEGVNNLDARKSVFEKQSIAMFTLLQSATAKLRRQVYALEEAGIIAAEAPTLAANAQQRQQPANAMAGRGGPAAQQQAEPGRITNGGLGNMDVGWLNSRGNKVGAEKEAELMEEAKDLAQQVLQDGRHATSSFGESSW